MTALRVFFLHNPKAGGSSLRSVLSSAFEADRIAPVFSNAPNEHRANEGSIERHRGYSFYAGHYGYDVFERLGEGHALVTNFRDPVQRIVSLYRFWRNNVRYSDLAKLDPRDAAVVLLSQELSFSDFIRAPNPDLLLYIDNYHFRQLFRSPWENCGRLPWHRLVVKRRISRMPWFYVAEMPEVSAALLKRAFPELSSVPIPSSNVSQGEPVELNLADTEYLMRLNRLDYAIYRHAVREQTARADG